MSRGDVQNAFKLLVRARDFCASGAHTLELCLSVLTVALELPNFTMHVSNYVSKAEALPEAAEPEAAAKARQRRQRFATPLFFLLLTRAHQRS